MTTFGLYLSLGIDHIADLAGYNHILFLMALCAVYSLKEWARVLFLVTGGWNIIQRSGRGDRTSHRFKYAMALFFCLIHGMGFSNYLRSLLGSEQDLLLPLFSFNLGLELGQVMIVLVVLLVSFLLVNVAGMKRREWNLLLSGAAIGVSFILCVERWPL